MQKRYQESAEWKAIREHQKKQMDNVINKEWLDGLEEIRKINAEYDKDDDPCEGDLSAKREQLNQTIDRTTHSSHQENEKKPGELPPQKGPIVVQQLRLAEEELLQQYKKEEEEKLRIERETAKAAEE
jgi:hypothetical protein